MQISISRFESFNDCKSGPFIADQKHPFFGSETFTAILRSVQQQPRRFKVYEKNGTLRLSVGDVKNMKQAKEALEEVLLTFA